MPMSAQQLATAKSLPIVSAILAAPALSGLALSLLAISAGAQTQLVKPPVAQYWMDVSTVSMAGLDDIPGMGDKPSSFGATRGMTPGRWLDLAVATQRKPDGAQAIQAIPPGMAMGGALTLQPVVSQSSKPAATGEPESHDIPEQPKGRLLLYWGCSDTVREGQPKVLDFSTASPQEYARFMTGRGVRQSGAAAAPGHAVWPNPQNPQSVPKGATLVGPHAVTGEGLPASLKFLLPSSQDIMPPLALAGSGGNGRATTISWTTLPSARAYFLNAIAANTGAGDQDMVIWSSSDVPEPGWGLMDYIGNSNLEAWLGDKVLLAATQTRCAIPAGIFAKTESAMVQGIAYGQDLYLTQPPRPTNPKTAWEPEWTAQIRVKSQAMLLLEQDGKAAKTARDKPLMPAIPGVPDLGGALGGAHKGLFGR